MGGIGSGVEVQQLAQHDAGAGARGSAGRGREQGLGHERVVGVVGDQQGGLLGGGDLGGLGGRGVLAGEQALVGALAQLPQHRAHDEGGHEQDDEEDGLVAGNHGWLTSAARRRAHAPLEDRGGQGLGDAGLVVGVVEARRAVRCRRRASGAISTATAGQVMLSMAGRAVRPRVTVMPAWSRAELSTPARARLRVTQAACAVFQGTKRAGCGGRQRGDEEVDAGAALGGVQAEAGLGVGVVGDFGAAVGVDGRVGFAGGDDRDAARGQQGTQPDAEGQGDRSFPAGCCRLVLSGPPESSPPWAASSTTTKRAAGAGGACAAAKTAMKAVSGDAPQRRSRRADASISRGTCFRRPITPAHRWSGR